MGEYCELSISFGQKGWSVFGEFIRRKLHLSRYQNRSRSKFCITILIDGILAFIFLIVIILDIIEIANEYFTGEALLADIGGLSSVFFLLFIDIIYQYSNSLKAAYELIDEDTNEREQEVSSFITDYGTYQ